MGFMKIGSLAPLDRKLGIAEACAVRFFNFVIIFLVKTNCIINLG